MVALMISATFPTVDGIFHDCAIHDIDLLCWTVGEFPTHVFASATAHREDIAALNDFDTVIFQLTFPSGAFGVTDISRFAVYGYDQRLEVRNLCSAYLCLITAYLSISSVCT